MYVAECLEVGIVSQGRAVEEVAANLKEAMELYRKSSNWKTGESRLSRRPETGEDQTR